MTKFFKYDAKTQYQYELKNLFLKKMDFCGKIEVR